MEQPSYYSVDGAAARLDVHPNLIYREVKAGRLPHIKVGRKVIRIPRQALEAWEQAQLEGGRQ
ncbi:hypothetical protein DAETH_01620 [Deinococcus aetherius]|uniref:Helix-turn-helix domain-containing protein n=1 Tax=Deinococcus aetherius TaxID=200252 RepID=A0ABM8A970_9DEIO|nr:helix-turn-helix domain-containing protein [Deinococcus aetherius]BDP40193.1 hypothetical protein DAETH_01620 [Deinococcus aetherius]